MSKKKLFISIFIHLKGCSAHSCHHCNLHTAIFAHKPVELKEYTTIFKLPSVKRSVFFNASISRPMKNAQYLNMQCFEVM